MEAGEVVLIPACLLLEHGTQRLESEGLTGTVEGDSDAAEAKAISQQCRNDFTSSEGAKTGIVEGHAVRQ